MDNLYFERSGQYVKDKLISKPVLLERTEGWELWHLPTHETHLYDVHRLKIKDSVEVETKNKCHVLSLVEGSSVTVQTGERSLNISYAETFIIPAAAKKYRIINRSSSDALVVKAFVK
jgi:mannose-6-phosphate isomerase class I